MDDTFVVYQDEYLSDSSEGSVEGDDRGWKSSTAIAAISWNFTKSCVTKRDPTKRDSFVPAVMLRTLSEFKHSAGHEPNNC